MGPWSKTLHLLEPPELGDNGSPGGGKKKFSKYHDGIYRKELSRLFPVNKTRH
jgi:hypothetical protein